MAQRLAEISFLGATSEGVFLVSCVSAIVGLLWGIGVRLGAFGTMTSLFVSSFLSRRILLRPSSSFGLVGLPSLVSLAGSFCRFLWVFWKVQAQVRSLSVENTFVEVFSHRFRSVDLPPWILSVLIDFSSVSESPDNEIMSWSRKLLSQYAIQRVVKVGPWRSQKYASLLALGHDSNLLGQPQSWDTALSSEAPESPSTPCRSFSVSMTRSSMKKSSAFSLCGSRTSGEALSSRDCSSEDE